MKKKENPTKQAGAYLGTDEGNALKTLLDKVSQLKALNEAFLMHLPPTLRAQCQVANIVDRRLVILAANSAIATQLRLEARDLLARMKKDKIWGFVQELQFKVNLHQTIPRHRTRKPAEVAPLSEETAEMVKTFASTLKDDALRKVMEKIAKHTKSK